MYYNCHMNTMVCPKCKKEFEITEAISHKMREDVLAKASIEHKEELEKQRKQGEEKTKLEIDRIRQQAQKEIIDKGKASQLGLLETQKKLKLSEEKMRLLEKEQKEKEE